MSAPVYRGPFGTAQAERLLWRAGFGPRPGEAARLARKGLDGAIHSLTHPGRERLKGKPPTDNKGKRLSPYDAYGHDHLWWLDRMVRTSRPLHERMTLIWHDWFATSNDGVGSQVLMLEQNTLFRRHALGTFSKLLLEVTRDPAMLIWLNGVDNEKEEPNENYARELMELFTLGAGRGYGERDVREQARALTGFAHKEKNDREIFYYDRERHDTDSKRIFGKSGRFTWRDSVRLCVEHPKHPSFFVRKMWGYFIPTPPSARTQRALERLYTGSADIRAVVIAILKHPDFYRGPRMVKPPVVHTAGLLRGMRRPVDTSDWVWIANLTGQRLFYPPNVSGWDDSRWLDTMSFRGRWLIANYALYPEAIQPSRSFSRSLDPDDVLARAHAFWGKPTLSTRTQRVLLKFARGSIGPASASRDRRVTNAVLAENALRQLIAVSPDLLTA